MDIEIKFQKTFDYGLCVNTLGKIMNKKFYFYLNLRYYLLCPLYSHLAQSLTQYNGFSPAIFLLSKETRNTLVVDYRRA